LLADYPMPPNVPTFLPKPISISKLNSIPVVSSGRPSSKPLRVEPSDISMDTRPPEP
jgi:hypothetical protein